MSTNPEMTPRDGAEDGDGPRAQARPRAGRGREHVLGHDREHVVRRDRETVVGREVERYGGVKVGSAFFGWLTATGTAVLLTALAAAAGTVVALATGTTTDQVAGAASKNPATVGLAGVIVLIVIILIAYYCGGYVAGRMARFNGMKQGLAVWLWAVAIAIVVAVVGALAGSRFNILAQLNSFPRIPINEGTIGPAGILAVIVVAVAALVGSLLGGMAGMHFHRKVDKAGLDDAGLD